MKRKIGKLMVVISIIALAVSGVSQAQLGPVTVPNYSFELDAAGTPRNPDGSDGTNDVTTDLLAWNDSHPGDWSAGSNQSGDANLYDGFYLGFAVNDGYLWQILSQPIGVGEEYQLTIDAAGVPPVGAGSGDVLMSLVYDDGGALVDIVSETKVTTGTPDTQFDYDLTLSFTALAGENYIGKNLGIKLGAADNKYTHFDNVRLDIIPEPATMVLLGIGSLALLRRRRA